MEEFQYELKIPKDRIAVLIGKNGGIKKEVEKSTNTSIDIDSKEGDVFIKGNDGLGIYTAKEVIIAVGRGFNPEIAMLLLKPDYTFELISLKDIVGKSKDAMQRLKGRVIGREGKSRHLIEELSETYISVYGKTIGIIGSSESSAIARQAVESLLGGATHANVYKFLEKKRRDLKRAQYESKEYAFKEEIP